MILALAVAVFFLGCALAIPAIRWAGKPAIRIDRDHPGALGWLDEQDQAHHHRP